MNFQRILRRARPTILIPLTAAVAAALAFAYQVALGKTMSAYPLWFSGAICVVGIVLLTILMLRLLKPLWLHPDDTKLWFMLGRWMVAPKVRLSALFDGIYRDFRKCPDSLAEHRVLAEEALEDMDAAFTRDCIEDMYSARLLTIAQALRAMVAVFRTDVYDIMNTTAPDVPSAENILARAQEELGEIIGILDEYWAEVLENLPQRKARRLQCLVANSLTGLNN